MCWQPGKACGLQGRDRTVRWQSSGGYLLWQDALHAFDAPCTNTRLGQPYCPYYWTDDKVTGTFSALFTSLLQTCQCWYTLLPDGLDIIEYKRGADTPAIEFAGDMQVFAGAASCGAGNANHITRMNYCPFDDKNFREMTITDGVPTMPQGYILAGSLVLSDLHDHTLHHAITLSPRARKSSPPWNLLFPVNGSLRYHKAKWPWYNVTGNLHSSNDPSTFSYPYLRIPGYLLKLPVRKSRFRMPVPLGLTHIQYLHLVACWVTATVLNCALAGVIHNETPVIINNKIFLMAAKLARSSYGLSIADCFLSKYNYFNQIWIWLFAKNHIQNIKNTTYNHL